MEAIGYTQCSNSKKPKFQFKRIKQSRPSDVRFQKNPAYFSNVVSSKCKQTLGLHWRLKSALKLSRWRQSIEYKQCMNLHMNDMIIIYHIPDRFSGQVTTMNNARN